MIADEHFLGLRGVPRDTIENLLDLSERFLEISRRRIKKVPTLKGRTILNVFYENSTRTRVSFELAEKRLSADSVNISASTSSVKKGETLLDTAKTLDAMHADAVIIRHGISGAPHFLSQHIQARVLNAGDGQHEHPTQALLDFLTIKQRHGKLEGLRIAMVGDVAHSRVARSNLIGMRTLGCNVVVAAPSTLVPRAFGEVYGCEVTDSVDQAVEGAHVIMALRLQRERMSGGLLPDLREYHRYFGVSERHLRRAHPDAILMHPGPVNRGVELSADLADCNESVILTQVENGVAVRMALLFAILGGDA